MSRLVQLVGLLVPVLFLAGPLGAASVRVEVVDEDGSPVGRAQVRMQVVGGHNAPRQYRLRFRSLRADAAGRVEFTGIGPGQYVVEATTADRAYIAADGNPLAQPVQLTIDNADQVVEVRLALHRGTRLCTRFVIDGSRLDAGGRVQRRELENGFQVDHGLRREQEHCVQLFTGRWELRFEPPSGYLLVDLDVNGTSIEGHVATLDIRPGSPSQFATWYLVALARVEGRVYFEGHEFGVAIQAELIEAGDWLEQADHRGGSRYTPVIARPEPMIHDYAMDLPDGRWRLTVVGDDLDRAEPPEVQIEIGRGEQLRQDFTVRGSTSGSKSGMTVSVYRPDSGRADDAVVELWPLDAAERAAEPLARKRTQRWGRVYFPGLEPDSYRLVAGHAEFRENARTIQFDPEDRDTRSHSIRLRRASELKVRLEPGEEGETIDGTIALQRNDEPLDTELGDPKLIARLEHPTEEFDATNRAWVRGIYAGTYVVRGTADDVFFEFRHDGDWVDEVELTFGDAQSVELEARIVPAATLSGTLFCKGGEPLPSRVEVRVVPSTARPADPLDLDWESEIELSRELLLGGEHRDGFLVGPLEPASYLVAVQPATFDRWTWAFGSEDGSEAQSLEVNPGKGVEVGALGIDCGPALRLTVGVRSGRAAPDLGDVRWSRDLELEATIVSEDGSRYEVEQPTLERYGRLLILRGLREGTVEGRLRLRHRYFVPDEWVEVPFAGELERGRTIAVTAAIADVGGALELTDGSRTAVAARLIDAEGVERIETLEQGRADFYNLHTGTYRPQLCADAECFTVVHEWEPAEVEMLATLPLRR